MARNVLWSILYALIAPQVLLGCGGGRFAHASHPSPSTGASNPATKSATTSLAPTADAPEEARLAAHHPPTADTSTLQAALGEATLKGLLSATSATRSEVRVIAASTSIKEAGNNPQTIGGYPMVGGQISLDSTDTNQLLHIISQNKHYNTTARIRCAPGRALGYRFASPRLLEVVVTFPCSQALWTFATEQGIQRWGALLSPEATQAMWNAGIDSSTHPLPPIIGNLPKQPLPTQTPQQPSSPPRVTGPALRQRLKPPEASFYIERPANNRTHAAKP